MTAITVSVDKDIVTLMAALGAKVRDAANEAVVNTTEQAKRRSQEAVAAALTPRAGNLIGSDSYLNNEAGEREVVGFTHSRWFRAPRGGKTVGASSRLKANDVLALHASGGTILPANKGWLRLSFMGRLLRRSDGAQLSYKDPDIDVIPITTKSGKTALLVVDRRGGATAPRGMRGNKRPPRARGKAIEILLKDVQIPQRIQMAPVVQYSERRLAENFIVSLAKRRLN
ncbi:MAG: hypothetical protein K0R61_2373 [Microvirga sp.]|jgi:hypothetical protein|nr:hypothetical protein [Microvirga sp.]MDF2971923.1 hypothetical protein [Microvirga sp.]